LTYDGPHCQAVIRSLITLKALTYAPTGGVAAALTTSLPEDIGGVRNWDYRYCWLRDATFTLYALVQSGYTTEAAAWRDWLVRAVAGEPSQTQTLYAVDGDRRLDESELPGLAGYEGSRPVRVGNAAADQLQLDLFGEVMDCLHAARLHGLPCDENAWRVQKQLMRHLETVWRGPDSGIWEIRGPRRQLTHSKVMVWVAFDRAVRGVEQLGLDGPVDRWRALRQEVHDDVCRHGYDPARNSFVQSYGTDELDASLLMIPMVGFLPPQDPRVTGTVDAIERELMHDGFVRRYRTESGVDSLPGDEGAFLLCSFWLADAWALMGRRTKAEQLFERLLSLRNDVGLLSEEYDTSRHRLVGNFPQAFSHVALVNTARTISPRETGPSQERGRTG
jgi:GH15 family glucan-1,4-alpha-glucosidase